MFSKRGDVDIDTIIIITILVLFLIVGLFIIAKYTGRTGDVAEQFKSFLF